jgi:hypothetical protein
MLFIAISAAGCGQSARSDSASVEEGNRPSDKRTSTISPLALVSTSQQSNLGLVMLGGKGQATYTVSNVSDHRLTLKLGRPSCGCLSATLSKESLGPGESGNVELVLGDHHSAGLREGGVAVGATGMEAPILLFAKGVIEGMNIDPCAIKVPSDDANFVPKSIRGEIISGAQREDATVEIRQVVFADEGDDAIEFGAPSMSPLENTGVYARRRFEIPIRLRGRPKTVSHDVRITYCIGDTVADGTMKLNVFPAAHD